MATHPDDATHSNTDARLAAAQQQIENLSRALESRHLIGMAQGLLMARYGLTQKQAFAYLARCSQEENIKLREVARRAVLEHTSGPKTVHAEAPVRDVA